MNLEFQAELPPLRRDPDGGWRIGETRVLLELVLRAFLDGATPEAIAQRFESLSLAEVYTVIALYLRHRAALEQYLSTREIQAEQIRGAIESRQGDLRDLRSRILSRRSA